MTEFTKLGLSPTTLQAVTETGYTNATPIQAQAIPVALTGRDVLGIAQTGTGKTAAFTLPLIERLSTGRARARMPRAVVLCPTRELADQVAENFAKYAKGTRLNWVLLIGGVSMGDQVALLNKGVDVLIATPGRLLDLFERGKILLTGVETMVVDEADRMLDMGFIPDIERIFKLTPPRRQTLFFSATMPPEITRLTQQFLKDPTRIEVSRPAQTADTITQYLTRLPVSDPKAKRTALRMLIQRSEVQNGIVFCNRKSDVDIVAKSLTVHGFDAAPIHGDLDQSLRMQTLQKFRNGELKLLVASDVAARGLDIPEVSHVFNYDVPHHADDYVHRIGRTGRAGRTGEAFMITTPADEKSLDKVLKLIKKDPVELELEGVDFAAIKDRAPRGKDEGRSSRGRRERTREPKPSEAEATIDAVTAEEEPKEATRSRRSRSRRKPEGEEQKAVIETAIEAVDTPEAVAGETETKAEKPGRNRGRNNRKLDKAEVSTSALATHSAAFGDDIPAFLRRPVIIPA
ncbi:MULTISPECIES: DEAD/DEAH box helicase [unclassified Brevundimonas]|uniref:DEAD/DEAH box helicase n=1 Tax=unclassified Brevundimonas TaxID=2622653 RepID=UPI0025C01874|nr:MULTISPECIES: DEAD/DEAH box helicase [unclassified Brevundimonas]